MKTTGEIFIKEINKSTLEISKYEMAIQILKNPPIGKQIMVSQIFLEAIYDKAGKEVLEKFLKDNEIRFINNKGEDCEAYLKT